MVSKRLRVFPDTLLSERLRLLPERVSERRRLLPEIVPERLRLFSMMLLPERLRLLPEMVSERLRLLPEMARSACACSQTCFSRRACACSQRWSRSACACSQRWSRSACVRSQRKILFEPSLFSQVSPVHQSFSTSRFVHFSRNPTQFCGSARPNAPCRVDHAGDIALGLYEPWLAYHLTPLLSKFESLCFHKHCPFIRGAALLDLLVSRIRAFFGLCEPCMAPLFRPCPTKCWLIHALLVRSEVMQFFEFLFRSHTSTVAKLSAFAFQRIIHVTQVAQRFTRR